MSGKKDRSVVAVISGLTSNQAAQISKDIMKSKQKYAPSGRGTIAAGFTSSVGSSFRRGTKGLEVDIYGKEIVSSYKGPACG